MPYCYNNHLIHHPITVISVLGLDSVLKFIFVCLLRVGFPIIFRVAKDITFKDLQLLIRREMPQEVRNAINKEVVLFLSLLFVNE